MNERRAEPPGAAHECHGARNPAIDLPRGLSIRVVATRKGATARAMPQDVSA